MYRRQELRHKNKKKELKQLKMSASVSIMEQQLRVSNRSVLKSLSLPCSISIETIYVFDLKSVYILRVNSPIVAIECGSWRGETKPKFKSGAAAEWFNVDMKFDVINANSNLVAIVSSQGHDGNSARQHGLVRSWKCTAARPR